jgi:hypothetical protein
MEKRRTATWAAMVAGIVLALAAGCGGPSEQAGGSVSTSTSGPTATPPGPEMSPPGPETSPPPRTGDRTPPPPTGKIIVRGRVEEGVEPGCVVLRSDSGPTYLLVGADPAIARPGARVEVFGDVRIDMLTTCMQGTPLAVERIRTI